MLDVEIESLQKAAYSNPLRPGKIQELGEHVQVWACHMRGHHARRMDKFLTFTGAYFTDGGHEFHIAPDELQAGKRGIPVSEFARLLWSKLPHVTQKTRVVLAVWDSAENYGPLDVHDLDENLTYHPAGGDAFSLKYVQGDVNLEFLDLRVWFPHQEMPETLADLGLEAHQRHEDTPPGVCEGKDTWQIYRTLRDTLEAEFNLHPAKYRTPAAAAARIFVSSYLQDEVGMTQKSVRLQAMKSYWGGRAEAFARGKFEGEFSIYDAVSLYPSAAIALGEMPRASSWFRLTPGNMRAVRGGICTVKFWFPGAEYVDKTTGEITPADPDGAEIHPCLPVRSGNSMIYPLSGVSHCTVHEVLYALELGAKIELVSGYGYLGGDDSLTRYSVEFLKRKNDAEKAGNTAHRTLFKMLMNALYGKFGQHRVDYNLNTMRAACRALCLPDLGVLDKVINWPDLAGDALAGGDGEPIEKEIIVGGQWCPEWAALIQGYARMIESRAMRDYVAMVGTTDSVLIQGDAGEEFVIEGVLFKKETSGNRLVVVRSRLYALAQDDTIVKIALHGAPKTNTMAHRLMYWRNDEEIKIDVERVQKLRDGLTRNLPVGRKKKDTLTVSMRWDGKREITPDGYSTALVSVE